MMITVEEAALQLRVKPKTIHAWIQSGRNIGPKFRKIGQRRLIEESDLKDFLENGNL